MGITWNTLLQEFGVFGEISVPNGRCLPFLVLSLVVLPKHTQNYGQSVPSYCDALLAPLGATVRLQAL